MLPSAIEIKGLTKTFPGSLFHPVGTPALQDIHLTITQSEIFGVLGPNGAGKTTLLNILCTLLEPDAGQVVVLGQPLGQDSARFRSRINLCSGNANFAWSLTVEENLRFYGLLYGLRGALLRQRLDHLLEVFGLTSSKDRRFDAISTGTKQRLALAKALLNEPELLFLDEPTVGLDPDMAQRVRAHILEYHRRTGATIVLTTHYMAEAEQLCARIAFLREGRILALGTAAELKAQVHVSDLEHAFLELAK